MTKESQFALDCINYVIEQYRDDPGEWCPDQAKGDEWEDRVDSLRSLRGRFVLEQYRNDPTMLTVPTEDA